MRDSERDRPPRRAAPQVEDEKKAAEALLREREAYLRQLYTPFVPMWRELWEEGSTEARPELQGGEGGGTSNEERRVGVENGQQKTGGGGEGEDDVGLDSAVDAEEGDGGRPQQRPTMWWRGADAPHIWKGPPDPAEAAAAWGCRRATPASGRLAPGARFVPAERALLDGLDPQPVSVGRLSREYLALLGLPHESVRDMYKKARSRVCAQPRTSVRALPRINRIFSTELGGCETVLVGWVCSYFPHDRAMVTDTHTA